MSPASYHTGRFFSYEHFYVIFSKFTDLDDDADGELSCDDLLRYGNGAISQRATERIFCLLRRGRGHIKYEDFVWFLLSEEDKSSSTAVGFWFRVLDVDDDGRVSRHDMEHLYTEQRARLLELSQVQFANMRGACGRVGQEGFRDFTAPACPVRRRTWLLMTSSASFSMLCTHARGMGFHDPTGSRSTISAGRTAPCYARVHSRYTSRPQHSRCRCHPPALSTCLRSKLCPQLVNMLCNIDKFLASEAQDMHALRQAHATPHLTDFERWASLEYWRVTEEQDQHQHGAMLVDDNSDD